MALGPDKLREPNAEDIENIRSLEQQVDNSHEFANFLSGTVKVPVASMFLAHFMKRRADIRKNEFIRRYKQAGWFSVRFVDDGIVFSEVDPSEGRS